MEGSWTWNWWLGGYRVAGKWPSGGFRPVFYVAVKVDGLGGRIDSVNESLGARIDSVNESIGGRFDALAARLDARIDSLSGRMQAHVEQHAD
jgi:hypothetical protein